MRFFFQSVCSETLFLKLSLDFSVQRVGEMCECMKTLKFLRACSTYMLFLQSCGQLCVDVCSLIHCSCSSMLETANQEWDDRDESSRFECEVEELLTEEEELEKLYVETQTFRKKKDKQQQKEMVTQRLKTNWKVMLSTCLDQNSGQKNSDFGFCVLQHCGSWRWGGSADCADNWSTPSSAGGLDWLMRQQTSNTVSDTDV